MKENQMGLAKSLLLLGSNLGDKEENLKSSLFAIGENENCEIILKSSVYETEPWGVRSLNSYLNQAILIETKFNPFILLTFLQEIEEKIGRTRLKKWEDRIIDIDILLFNDYVLDSMDLKIPHPELINRKFSLIPACEIVPDWNHPLFHKSLKYLLEICPDKSNVSLKV